jgi:hypothetical protein
VVIIMGVQFYEGKRTPIHRLLGHGCASDDGMCLPTTRRRSILNSEIQAPHRGAFVDTFLLSVTVRTHLIKHFLDLFPLWSESTRLQTQGQLLALRSSLEWVALGVRWESHWWLPVAIKLSSLGDGRIRTRRYVNICVFSHFSVIN